MMRTDACLDCRRPFTYEYSRGRPRTRCDDCKAGRDHHGLDFEVTPYPLGAANVTITDKTLRNDENFRPEPKEIP